MNSQYCILPKHSANTCIHLSVFHFISLVDYLLGKCCYCEFRRLCESLFRLLVGLSEVTLKLLSCTRLIVETLNTRVETAIKMTKNGKADCRQQYLKTERMLRNWTVELNRTSQSLGCDVSKD